MGKVSNPYNFNIEQNYNSYSNISESYLAKFTGYVMYFDGYHSQSLCCDTFNGDTSWIGTAGEYIYLASFDIQYIGRGISQGDLSYIFMQINYDYSTTPAKDNFPDNIKIKINNIILNMPLIQGGDGDSIAYYGYNNYPKEPKEIFEIADELYQASDNNPNITITIISQNLNSVSTII